MPRLPKAKDGTPLTNHGLKVDFSFWSAKKTTRWKLQRRLFVKDPWAILLEAAYRHEPALPKPKADECLSYLEQAEEYFNAAMQGRALGVKPVRLYYSLLNLAKCLILVRNPTLDMAQARHGLVATPKGRATLGDQFSVKKSGKYVNIFDKLMIALEGGTGASFKRSRSVIYCLRFCRVIDSGRMRAKRRSVSWQSTQLSVTQIRPKNQRGYD